jgi:hypothetical protein
MSADLNQIEALIAMLGFEVVDQNTALGQVRGSPMTLTVIGNDPMALTLTFRVNPQGHESQRIVALLEGLSEKDAAVSFDVGYVWLSLYDLSGVSNDLILRLVIANYSAFWIVNKLALIGAIWLFCAASASDRKIARLNF